MYAYGMGWWDKNMALPPDMVAYIIAHGFDIVDLSVESMKITRDLRMKMLC